MKAKQILEGRYALVTGATKGVGRAIADALAAEGANVAVVSRRLDECRKAAAEIARQGVQSIGLDCDVSLFSSVQHMFERLRHWSSERLDVLVCNAGFPFVPEIWDAPLHATPPDQLEGWYLDIFKTDALGSVYCTYGALPLMMARRYGSILYISSTPALEGYQGTPYTIAKSGILGLMRDVARNYGRFNIRANAFALGNIETPATYESLTPEVQAQLGMEAPLGRWGKPEEIGRAALFIASELSSFITGQTIVVDGGTVRR